MAECIFNDEKDCPVGNADADLAPRVEDSMICIACQLNTANSLLGEISLYLKTLVGE